MLCSNCGHDREAHTHFHAKTYCSVQAPKCPCVAFAHPLPARWHDRWHRLLLWIRSQ